MTKIKAGNARNSTAIAKFSNAEVGYFGLKLIVHVLIRGSLDAAAACRQIRFGVVLCLIVFSVGVRSAELPSDKQCLALWARQSAIKPEIEGWCLLIDRNKGNCLACHSVKTSSWPIELSAPGNIGPELRGPPDHRSDRTALKRIIYDPSLQNPRTIMPLFGKHRILTNEEIDLITKFLMTIQGNG